MTRSLDEIFGTTQNKPKTLDQIFAPAPIKTPPIKIPINQLKSSHTSTTQQPKSTLKTAFIKGTLGSNIGEVLTPLAEKIAGREVDLSTLPESQTFAQKAIETGSNLVADLPLWLAGDAILAKPLGALAKTTPIAKTLNIVPKTIKPALGTGVRAGATYGGVVAPVETILEGDGLQGLVEREKQVPMMALGGTALHGAGQLVGKGVKSGIDYAKFNKLTKLPESKINPLEEVQNAYKSPTIRDAKADQLNKTFADTSNNLGRTGQIAPKQGMNPNELLRQKQLDAEGVFGKPINNKKYTFKTSEQKAFQELQDGISEAQNYVRHTDVLAPYPAGTTIEQAYADIKANTGVDLPKLMEAWNKTQTLKNKMTPEELRLGRAAGVIPKLKPRDTSFPAQVENRVPINMTQERLTWTNRDGIQNAGNLPIKSITEENLGQLPSRQGNIPLRTPTSGISNLGETTGIEIPMVNGRADVGNVVETPRIRTMNANIERPNETLIIDNLRNSNVPRANIQSQVLPEPQSKIIIGKPKEGTSFKDSLKKFYVKTVNSQQPIFDVGKVANSDLGKLASNAKNVSGIVDYNFLNGLVDKNGNKVGESLKSTVEAIPKGKEQDFWTYMSLKHNIDRAREGKPVQANYTPEQSLEAVRRIDQTNPEYKAIGENITKWIDDFMKTWGVDTGIVNKELYGNLRQTYKNYFPTQRDFSELEKAIPDNVSQKFMDQKTPIKKATGSERDILDPTENIMNLVNRTIRVAKYNEVGQSLLNTVRENPDKMKQFAEVVATKDGMFSNLDNVITVLENGKPTYLQINNRMLLDSMNGLPKSIGKIPVLDTLMNGFKGLITQKNPIFAIRNIFRDVPTSYVYGSESNPFKFGKDLIGAGKDIVTNSPNLQRYQAVGGGGANFFSSGDVSKSASELVGNGSKIKKGLTLPIKAIEKFNNLTETAPRLAEFNRVFEKTGDVTKALFAANDVSVNFSRSGNLTKNVDKGVPYLNASVQGLDKFFRGFKDPKVAIATIVKSGIAITSPEIATYLANRNNPNYQALDNRTKDTYFLIPNLSDKDENGNSKTFIKVPKSRELGVLFSSLLERTLRATNGDENAFKGFGNTVKTSFGPVNPVESNIATPILNTIYTNKDFANRSIVPQAMLMDERSRYLQYDEKTTTIAKAIGELTTNIPGLPEGLSPKQIDYLIKSYSGILGQIGIPLATTGGSPVKALSTQFISDPNFSNQTTTDFYDRLDKVSKEATDKNILEEVPSKKLTPEENIRNSMNEISFALSRGTKQINKLQASSDPNKDAKIQTIKIQMVNLTNKANSAKDPKAMQKVENEAKKVFKK